MEPLANKSRKDGLGVVGLGLQVKGCKLKFKYKNMVLATCKCPLVNQKVSGSRSTGNASWGLYMRNHHRPIGFLKVKDLREWFIVLGFRSVEKCSFGGVEVPTPGYPKALLFYG